jgi:hypothetical protein
LTFAVLSYVPTSNLCLLRLTFVLSVTWTTHSHLKWLRCRDQNIGQDDRLFLFKLCFMIHSIFVSSWPLLPGFSWALGLAFSFLLCRHTKYVSEKRMVYLHFIRRE